MSADSVREMAIETLAAENLELQERNRSLESDVSGYRLVAQASIEALAKVTRERDQARRELRLLREQMRTGSDLSHRGRHTSKDVAA